MHREKITSYSWNMQDIFKSKLMEFSVKLGITYVLDWKVLSIANKYFFRSFERSRKVKIVEVGCDVILCT